MSYDIGLNVVEVDGSGAPAIGGAATLVAAFNVVTRRGLAGTPGRISSFAGFVERFGGYMENGLGAYLVRGFFDNGGKTAYVSRVVPGTSTVASVTLNDAGPAATLRLEGGYRGTADPGSWGRELQVRTRRTSGVQGLRLAETAPATVQTPSAPLPAATDMVAAAFPALSVTVDGAATPTVIPFQASDFANPAQATRAELADAINRRTGDVDATLTPAGELVLTSTGNVAALSGGFTRLAVTTNATLGFPAPLTDDATAAAPAAGGATLHRADGLHAGDALQVSDGTTTETVKLLSVNPLTRAVTWTPALANPAVYDALLLRVATLEFDLDVFQGGTDADQRVEQWTGLSMEPDVANYVVARLNDPVAGSRFVRAVDEGSATPVGANRPTDAAAPLPLATGGVDGVPTAGDFAGDPVARTGFFAFDPYDVQLVTCERTDPAIAIAGIAYCEGRGDCMYVGAVPDGAIEGGTALAYGQSLQGAKVYGALYGPWVQVLDPAGVGETPIKVIPPVGHVMGAYARVESTRGIWKAPAGDEARLRGVLDPTYRLTDAEHTNLVKNAGINGIRAVPRAGVIIDASRTLSTDPRWLYVNVRLLFNYVKSSLRTGLRWVRQEPNREVLWNLVKYGSVTPFLTGLWRQGAFGTGAPSEVFTVICDAGNNPPDQVQLGFLNVEVYFYPSRPAETIVVKVGQQPGGAAASDA